MHVVHGEREVLRVEEAELILDPRRHRVQQRHAQHHLQRRRAVKSVNLKSKIKTDNFK